MAQSKHDKQLNALQRLESQLHDERLARWSLQSQSYKLVSPNEMELRLGSEIYNLKVKLGVLTPSKESVLTYTQNFCNASAMF